MKSIDRIIVFLFVALAFGAVQGHAKTLRHELPSIQESAKKDSTYSLLVSGQCGMCKTRIENALKGVPGIHRAQWVAETQQLTVTVDPRKIDKETIKKRVAAVGHDADGLLADDQVYADLHSCCLYPRVQKASQKVDEAGGQAQVTGVILHEDHAGEFTPVH